MRRRILAAVFLIGLSAALSAQNNNDTVWSAFMMWFKTAPPAGNPLTGYAAKLQADGKAPALVKQEIGVLVGLMAERSDWIGIYYDKVYVRSATGDPVTDGYASRPSALVARAIKDVTPGSALDVGMGQGRNAVFLAQNGWTVTGFDISSQALAASQTNATKAGVRLTMVNASYEAFDYGTECWDLIVLAFAWAPLETPDFVARLQKSLRPGGRVVVEHFIQPAGQAGPNIMHKLVPNELRSRFEAFEISFYEEAEGVGDWGGPGSQLVKMIAVKRQALP
jgi:SAM-dependent methyltransferase